MNYHKIGEKFLWHTDSDTTVELEVVKDISDYGCEKCYFKTCTKLPPAIQYEIDPCTATQRPDNTDVHFEEVK